MMLHQKYRTLFEDYGVNTPLRLAHWYAQMEHESNLTPQRESLFFTTILGLRKTFFSPFKGKSDSFVSQYLRNTEKCANYVYANRMGNGSESSGDGFKYRGAGFIQITGKNNFKKLSDYTAIDYISRPNLLENEADAVISALWYWKVNKLNRFADLDSLDALSDLINIGRITKAYGDSNGFNHRKILLDKWKLRLRSPA